jgi:transposase
MSIQISAQGMQPEAACPDCGTASQAVHSRYPRHPADLPSLGSEVHLHLCVRRFYCRNPACARITFAEPIPDLLAPRARRTRRFATAQGRIGVTCGGEAGTRLLHILGMPTSPDTVLRLVRAIPLPAHAPPQFLGVDDWARRKGQTYGTILVDLEEHRVVDLLPDRMAQTLATWLQEHDTVSVIARDRSTEYARGASLGAPEAIQVVDRWHLLQNLREMIERWLAVFMVACANCHRCAGENSRRSSVAGPSHGPEPRRPGHSRAAPGAWPSTMKFAHGSRPVRRSWRSAAPLASPGQRYVPSPMHRASANAP